MPAHAGGAKQHAKALAYPKPSILTELDKMQRITANLQP
jgi:hypothetical protein